MRKTSIGELRVLKERKSDFSRGGGGSVVGGVVLRGFGGGGVGGWAKPNQQTTGCSAVFEAPSRDFIVISSVRRPVPGEAIIPLNRLASVTDPASSTDVFPFPVRDTAGCLAGGGHFSPPTSL